MARSVLTGSFVTWAVHSGGKNRKAGTKFDTLAARERLSASEQLVGPAELTVAAEEVLRRASAPEDSELPMPRSMVVVAHPDDETIALGARMARFEQAHFVHITDGAPRNEQDSRAHGFTKLEDYRQARARELRGMFAEAGLKRVTRTCLEFQDQEASLNLAELTRRLAREIADHEPEVIITHPYEGGHPDHDACAFAVHHAVGLNRVRGGGRPLILETTFYHAGPGGLEPGSFLRADGSMPEVLYELSDGERKRKHKLVSCFTTQSETLKGFHGSTERFRVAPVYDFTHPPHGGKVLYEHYPWGMSVDRFCQLAIQAEAELDHEASGEL
jgi:N-acetylglucosamine malate deacetylase 2